MSLRWTSSTSDTGILRKNEYKEKKEELFVFGYSCKLFRDDEKAQHIDQGTHLIPWMGDETLKIDRYDARGALHDISRLEAPPGGYDWRVELTRAEKEVEQLCDEERYRALHTDEDEEEMYKEEELKRLHAAGNRQVGFNYDAKETTEEPTAPTEVDEPFIPEPQYKDLFDNNILFPTTEKQNAIIEKTAKFIASQGAQMEILIKAKQRDNPQFQFLNRENELHLYYIALTALVKAGRWPLKVVEAVEGMFLIKYRNPQFQFPNRENELYLYYFALTALVKAGRWPLQVVEAVKERPHEHEDYLHPSLASAVIESAPSIPSIHYKPSADCDYTMLISKMRGDTPEEAYVQQLAPGEVAPPGTEPLPPRAHAEISRAPVMYTQHGESSTPPPLVPPIPPPPIIPTVPPPSVLSIPPPPIVPSVPPPAIPPPQYAAYYHQYMAQNQAQLLQSQALAGPPAAPPAPSRSTGLSLMKNYNTDSGSDVSDCDDSSSSDEKDNTPKPLEPEISVVPPPEEIQVVIDKMAAYVARNGAEFAEIVRAKRDPRFTFLEPSHEHHAYYKEMLREKRGEGKARIAKAPVSFSIKKLKEPEPVLPKPALPYESSSDEETEKEDKQTENKDKTEETNNASPKPNSTPTNNIPVVQKPDGKVTDKINEVKPVTNSVAEVKTTKKDKTSVQATPTKYSDMKEKKSSESKKTEKSPKKYKKSKDKKEKSKSHKDKREDKEKKRDRSTKSKYKDDLESEIISLEDDVLIDLTGDQDSKADADMETERLKQQERRQRAAAFLKAVGVEPTTPLPTSSLASAMVDTLESLRKKKVEQEEKRQKREKRKNREKQIYEEAERSHRKSKRRKHKSSEDDESDHGHESSKKKKRKKEKKSSKSKKKRRKDTESEAELVEEIDHTTLNIDVKSTLKGLRTSSPTKEVLQDLEVTQQSFKESSSEKEEEEDVEPEKKKKKEDREYSEGEWSSDSENDSESVPSKNGDL